MSIDSLSSYAPADVKLIDMADGDGQIRLPAGSDFLRADFVRSGPDLLIETPNGAPFLVPDFFMSETAPSLITSDGAVLSGQLVTTLAGPLAVGQVAQIGTGLGLGGGQQTVNLGAPIGQVSEAEGDVSVTRADGTQEKITTGDQIFQGDVLETSANANVSVVFVDDTIFSLDEDGRMVMDEMVYDPDTQTGVFNAQVVQGVFSFVSGQVAKTSPDGMVVNTPTATIGIRGSTVVGKAAADGAENKITLVSDVDGNVGEISISNGAGTLTLNSAGATTTVFSATSAPTPIVTLSPADIQQSFGKSLTKLVKAVSQKANQDAQQAEQQAQKSEDEAQQADAEAKQAEQDAEVAQAEADTAQAEAEDAQAKLDAAEAEVAAAKAAAEAAGDEVALAKAQAAEAKLAEAAAKVAEIEAQAEAQAQAAAEAQAQAETKAGEAAAKATQAEAAQAEAQQAQQFSSLADTAFNTQAEAFNQVQATQADTAAKADTAQTVVNDAPVTDTATAPDNTTTTPTTPDPAAEAQAQAEAEAEAQALAEAQAQAQAQAQADAQAQAQAQAAAAAAAAAAVAAAATAAAAQPAAVVNTAPVNQAPSAVNAAVTITEDSSLISGNVTATDAEGGTLTYSLSSSNAANATVAMDSTGAYTYTPAADYFGTDSFSFTATDNSGLTSTGTVTVDVTGVNDAPVVMMSTGGGSGALAFTNTYNFSTLQTSFQSNDSKVVDMDGDGDLDIVINGGEATATTGPWHTYVGLNDGAGNFTYTANLSGIYADGQADLSRFDVGDVNGDGNTDVVGIRGTNGMQAVFLGDGAGGLTSTGQTFNFLGGTIGGNNIKLSDLDNDGDLDIYAAIDSGGKIFLNDGNGTFTDTGTPLNHASVLSYRGTAIGDVNGDGNQDIISGSWSGETNSYNLWTGDGAGGFTYAAGFGGNASAGNGLELGDVDGDGDLDLVSFNRYSGSKVFLNDGNGTFTAGAVLGANGPARQDGLLKDMDGDGDLDVLVTGDATLEYYANDGNGNFTYTGFGLGTSWLRDISAGDFDGDGDVDILAVDQGTGSQILTNTTPIYADTLTQGGTIIFQTSNLVAADVDNTNSGLIYKVVTVPTTGSVLLNNVAMAANATFTQADIDAGNIKYVQNGTAATSDSFTFTVTDGLLTTAVQTFALAISNDITGTAGADTITLGTALASGTVDLGAGTDSLTLADGANTLTVSNTETITGGTGADAITLGTALASGTIDLGAGTDALTLANGTNTLSISNTETITGGTGADSITLGAAQASGTINLGTGVDSLTLANGTNSLTVLGAETLTGGTGADTIVNGDATNMTIIGGAGADTFTGNTGVETYTYTTVTDSAIGAMDTITNITAGGAGDKIDTNIIGTMSVITNQVTNNTFANLTLGTLNTLTNSTNGTLGANSLTGDGVNTQAIQLTTSDGAGVWAIDVDGNGVFDAADTILNVTGGTGVINAADFV